MGKRAKLIATSLAALLVSNVPITFANTSSSPDPSVSPSEFTANLIGTENYVPSKVDLRQGKPYLGLVRGFFDFKIGTKVNATTTSSNQSCVLQGYKFVGIRDKDQRGKRLPNRLDVWDINILFSKPGSCVLNLTQTESNGQLRASRTIGFAIPKSENILTFQKLNDMFPFSFGRPLDSPNFPRSRTADQRLVGSSTRNAPFFISETPSTCQVDGNYLKSLRTGECIVSAIGAEADDFFNAANPQKITHKIQIVKYAQPLSQDGNNGKFVSVLEKPSIGVSRSFDSGIPEQVTSLTPNICTVNKVITFLSEGVCQYSYFIPGNDLYQSASVIRNFRVFKAKQDIWIKNPSGRNRVDLNPFAVKEIIQGRNGSKIITPLEAVNLSGRPITSIRVSRQSMNGSWFPNTCTYDPKSNKITIRIGGCRVEYLAEGNNIYADGFNSYTINTYATK